jgi:hypothetical protein
VTDNTEDRQDEAKSAPEPSEDDVKRAKEDMAEIDERYDPGARPTVVMPGTHGTVAGTAFADLTDDDEQATGIAEHDEALDK